MRKAKPIFTFSSTLVLFAFCFSCSKNTAFGDHAIIQYRLPGATEDSYAETSDAAWDPAQGKAFFQWENSSFERFYLSVDQLRDTGVYAITSIQQMTWSQSDRFQPQTVTGSLRITARTPTVCRALFNLALRDSLNGTSQRIITGNFIIAHQP